MERLYSFNYKTNATVLAYKQNNALEAWKLNPHFTFNAINTIGDSVLKGRQDEAYEYFTKLAELIRNSMANAFNLIKPFRKK